MKTQELQREALAGHMNAGFTTLNAFKRTKSLETSAWYMASLTTYLVEKKDVNGEFALIEALLVPGNEPPPHVHSREDELYYILEGEFDVYAGHEGFNVKSGECIFLPRLEPHAFVIRSARLRVLLMISPAGLEAAFRSMASPALKLELPTGMPTYATSDLTHTIEVFKDYGITLLSPEEIATQLPSYRQPLP